MAPFLRYADAVETIAPDERDTFDKIVAAMGKGMGITRERYGHSVRASHAKAHGLLTGELRVAGGLPPELAQGLFARGATYPTVVRLAHVPGELLDDRKVSTPRGMAIKVLGVDGPMLPAHQGKRTQDFVLDTGAVFNAPDAKAFLVAITGVEAAVPMPETVKGAVSATARAANRVFNMVGLNSPNLDFFGHPFIHPLAEPYYSQAAIRYGDHVAKLRVKPDTDALRALEGAFEPGDENGLRTAVVAYFRDHPAEFDVGIQLCTNLDAMPVEDASKEWPEGDSPYRTVARLVLPAQDAYSPTRQGFVEDDLLFCPAHSLAAHRPLGSIMRARMHAYEALGARRHEENGRPIIEPRALSEVPD